MKEFDLEKARKGANLISVDGDLGYYLYTMDRTAEGSEEKHILIFRSKDGNEYPVIVNNIGMGAYSHTVTRTSVSMAPKKVKYYFASWESKHNPEERRDSLQPFRDKSKCESEVERHNLKAMPGFMYHVMEIEE